MRPLLAFVLSLLTFFGGHCLNRRWDRVVVFSAALLLLILFPVGVLLFALRGDAADFDLESHLTGWGWLSVALLVLLASAVVAFRDGKGSGGQFKLAPLAGGVVLSLLGGAFAFSLGLQAFHLYSYHSMPSHKTGGCEYDCPGQSGYFRHQIMFSRHFWGADELPPHGEGIIAGQVLYEGEPVDGIELDLHLGGGQYKTEGLVTDEQGMFALEIEPREWHIDLVSTHRWENRPEGDFVILTGLEQPYTIPYRGNPDTWPDGLRVMAGTEFKAPHLSLRIEPAVAVAWPATTESEVVARPDEDVIQWHSPETATRHLVEVTRVRDSGTRSRRTSLMWREVQDNQRLPLNELPIVPAPGQTESYQVTVYSFDEEGRLVTKTGGGFRDRRFTLEGKRLVSEPVDRQTTSSAAGQRLEARLLSQDRVEAIDILMREELYDTVEKLLDRVEPAHLESGQYAALRGRLKAVTGHCDEALHWFEQARGENPDIQLSPCSEACPELADLVQDAR